MFIQYFIKVHIIKQCTKCQKMYLLLFKTLTCKNQTMVAVCIGKPVHLSVNFLNFENFSCIQCIQKFWYMYMSSDLWFFPWIQLMPLISQYIVYRYMYIPSWSTTCRLPNVSCFDEMPCTRSFRRENRMFFPSVLSWWNQFCKQSLKEKCRV